MSSTKKRKKKHDHSTQVETDHGDASAGLKRPAKKAKLGSRDDNGVGSTPVTKPRLEGKTKGENGTTPEVVRTKRKPREKEANKDKRGKEKQTPETVTSEGEGGDEAVGGSERGSSPPDSEEGDDGEYVPPVHESLAGLSDPDPVSSSKKGKKYVPPDETPDQRDLRTIFVGNVPSQVMVTKVSWR